MKRNIALIAFALLIVSSLVVRVPAQTEKEDEASRRVAAPDQEEDEDDLNRELWEFARKTPYETALRYAAARQQAAQAVRAAEVALPTGWRIAPAGEAQTEVGRFPYEVVFFNGKLVALDTGWYGGKDSQEVSIVDPASSRVEKTLKIKSLFPSAAVGRDGDLYLSGGYDQKVIRINKNFDVAREYPVKGYAAGLAAIDETHLAVAYLVTPTEREDESNARGDYVAGRVAILNTGSGDIERDAPAGFFPYDVKFANGKIYVTALGENKLRVFDTKLNSIKTLPTEKTPQTMCADNSRLYVVNTGADSVSIFDTTRDALVATLSVARPLARYGATPTSCATDEKNLYVTLGGINAVAVYDKASRRFIGYVPSGWYPTKVLSDERKLFILSAKGIRARRPNPDGPQPAPPESGKPFRGNEHYVLTLLKGNLSFVDKSSLRRNLPRWTRQVETSAPLINSAQAIRLPIKHIFYIVRENRTYDQVLGDLGRGESDPNLTIFGRDITPNAHALADKFVTLDNFFADGEISVLGHSFTTSGYASPFLEWLGNAAYSGRYRGYPFGTVPAVFSPAYVWDALDARRVNYRIYGEPYYPFTRLYRIIGETYGADSAFAEKFYERTMQHAAKTDRGKAFFNFARDYYGKAETIDAAARLLQDEKFARGLSKVFTGDDSFYTALRGNENFRHRVAEFLTRYAFNYSPWNLSYSDLDRVKNWREDFRRQLANGSWGVPAFNYIWLPNDHTAGVLSEEEMKKQNVLDPFQYCAQNDAALARLIETISHSAVWRDSLIIVMEDDAQHGSDHVDATRTVALAVSPYVRRGAVVNDRYDQLSAMRTVELLLNIEPLNLNDRMAVPMFSIFTNRPDFTPFAPVQPSKYLTPDDRARYEALSSQQSAVSRQTKPKRQ